ncbi:MULTISPECIES: DUF3180 domain-containing protein [Tsukamurella]|uniref:DUF3180 domain-containing protein n=1 Tax=Tsukamurella strandjordii TaxID=147577 RepID=A0AA90NAD8_9ACTN|nr:MULTISPECIES: DUF3180 domain-containing protein [Tsukamurella]MDP0396867.1 DUF3180 domain-containing protein [Tsukamurella strandjordii]GIZ96669.1 membrane protein [Tsukamurella sp. TY48]
MSAPSDPRKKPDEPQGSGVRSTGWVELAAIVLGVGLATYLLVKELVPPIPVWAGAMLYGVAAADLWIAQLIRSRLAKGEVGMGPGRLHPIAVARAVALAKASAYLGAVSLGFFGGALAFLLTAGNQLTATHADRPGAWIGLVGSVLLLASALWLERCCRTPDDPDEQPADTSPA